MGMRMSMMAVPLITKPSTKLMDNTNSIRAFLLSPRATVRLVTVPPPPIAKNTELKKFAPIIIPAVIAVVR